MAKRSQDIIKWGKLKPYFDRTYDFNTIDIETVDNELFIFGYTSNGVYHYKLDNFYNVFHDFLIECIQNKKDILTWSRYDNTHLVKLILSKFNDNDIKTYLRRIGKVSPIIEYKYHNFTVTIVNIIKDSIIFKFTDLNNKERHITLYNLKNLYDTDLEETAKNYHIDYYSKLGQEYHIIDKKRWTNDLEYQKMVIKSNELDNRVLLDISRIMLENFKNITGVYPKSIFTNGSLARSYLLATVGESKSKVLQFKSLYNRLSKFDKLLDYSMKAYHGGKIESYVLGNVGTAKIVDITSAYPYAMTTLPYPTREVLYIDGGKDIDKYFYAFINCEWTIDDPNFIHPCIVENPINKSNISPYGYMRAIITKPEYDYLIKHGIKVNVFDYVAVKHMNVYPYKEIVETLFNKRLETKDTNPSLSQMYKIILNSLYGITFELNDTFDEIDNSIEWQGYRAGDYFNPVIASYITAITRTSLSEVSNNIIKNGGKVYLNMTDSIIYDGEITLDVLSKKKILGKYEYPTIINECVILGAGRYEYYDTAKDKYVIKSRGFSANVKDKAFYNDLELNSEEIILEHKTFVTGFKATTKKYGYQKMGYLLEDTYTFNPFNLGGKRVIKNRNVNLNKSYTETIPVYLEREMMRMIK